MNTVPKEVAEAVARYRLLMEQFGIQGQQLRAMFRERMHDAIMTDFFITDNPKGRYQGDRHWCDEWTSDGKRFNGHYYWATEDGHYICVSYLSEVSLCKG